MISQSKYRIVLISFVLSFFIVGLCQAQDKNPNPHALSDAVLQGNIEMAKQLIAAGADVQVLDDRRNPNGRYPLNWAAWQNDVEMIKVLLEAGANISKPNVTGFTPLHHAIENGSKEAADYLIKHGADLTAMNRYDMTPLQFAQTTGQSDIEKMILVAQQ